MAMAIPKDEFLEMLTTAHLTYGKLAARIDRDVRTVSRWVEKGAVPDRYEQIVRKALAVDAEQRPVPGPLSAYSDYALLDEIARRMQARRTESQDSGWISADPDETL